MLRRTKILATLGPATDKKGVLESILDAGVNVVRINFSHGEPTEYFSRAKAVRKYAENNNTFVGILVDLQGPKIRIASFKDSKINLNIGDEFTLDADMDKKNGTQQAVGITYKTLPSEVKNGDILLLDDGRIVLKIKKIAGNKIICKVEHGGILSDKKGINLKGGGLSANAITDKDREDILIASKLDADFVALSFPVSGDDIRLTKKLLKEAGCEAGVIAKIERAEALNDGVIDDIINESFGIMVARGDLGIEIGDPLLPAEQKRLIKLARSNDRIVITATQMLESMIENPIPTRAEVFDVANSVLDGTDCVMLSAETAAGKFPVNAVKIMDEVCLESEKNPLAKISHHRLGEKFNHIDETIAMSTMYAANHLSLKAVVALTQTGSTALWMSRISSNVSIFAMSDTIKTLNKVTLSRGVYPFFLNLNMDWDKVNQDVVELLEKNKYIQKDDLIAITKGNYKGRTGGTNLMKIIKIGEGSY